MKTRQSIKYTNEAHTAQKIVEFRDELLVKEPSHSENAPSQKCYTSPSQHASGGGVRKTDGILSGRVGRVTLTRPLPGPTARSGFTRRRKTHTSDFKAARTEKCHNFPVSDTAGTPVALVGVARAQRSVAGADSQG